MSNKFPFTYSSLKGQYETALDAGYKFITCEEYCSYKKSGLPEKTIVNRVDIDLSVVKTNRLVEIFNELGVKATFFLRLHAAEYNPFSFENYNILKNLVKSGHELGYHSEIVDQAAMWDEEAEACLKRDIDIINKTFGVNITGIASHGGLTGLNNLDFWKNKKATDYGMLYEAYDTEPTFNLFNESFYISDSEWTRWKCYNKGVHVPNDTRNITEHLVDNHKLIYLLIHPDTYYNNHPYEIQ